MQKILFYLFISLLLIVEIKGDCQSNSSKKILYSDTSQFKNMEAVLNIPAFKGKVVYIDLWGTRCGPCLDEFKYLKVLKERYKDKPVSFLYLKSPYDFDDSKEWKEMVNRYNLEGINVSLSINFYVNGFWERFKKNYAEKNRLYGIPTYLIVNKNGQIINFDAPRPSKREILYKLIDKEL